MSSIAISGDTSGAVTITAPAVAGTNTMTLVAGTGSLAPKVLSTAVASTSGTAIDFTNIPSWVTRITVMFSGVSTSGSSGVELRIGTSAGIVATGYASTRGGVASTSGFTSNSTTGYGVGGGGAATIATGIITLATMGNNIWVASWSMSEATTVVSTGSGTLTLSGVLDRLRITAANGTDTFDAGTINIMYE